MGGRSQKSEDRSQSRDCKGAPPKPASNAHSLVSACLRARLGWKARRPAVLGSHGKRFFPRLRSGQASPWAFLEFTNPRQIVTANLPWLPDARGLDCLGRIGRSGRILLPRPSASRKIEGMCVREDREPRQRLGAGADAWWKEIFFAEQSQKTS